MPKRTVPVVDDDEGIREVVWEVLADEGYGVLEAREGTEALALAAATPPCVILLDMQMPGMDGWAFARECHHRSGDGAPLVCMTASVNANQCALDIAAEGMLPKPFEGDELVAVVDRFCRAG